MVAVTHLQAPHGQPLAERLRRSSTVRLVPSLSLRINEGLPLLGALAAQPRAVGAKRPAFVGRRVGEPVIADFEDPSVAGQCDHWAVAEDENFNLDGVPPDDAYGGGDAPGTRPYRRAVASMVSPQGCCLWAFPPDSTCPHGWTGSPGRVDQLLASESD